MLALQGAFIEHIKKLTELGVQSVEVRLPRDLQAIDGLIIPGGESSAIGRLMASFDLTEPVRRFASEKAVWGTCAGMILMAKRIERGQPVLGLMDIAVERNAFGRQIDSFEEAGGGPGGGRGPPVSGHLHPGAASARSSQTGAGHRPVGGRHRRRCGRGPLVGDRLSPGVVPRSSIPPIFPGDGSLSVEALRYRWISE